MKRIKMVIEFEVDVTEEDLDPEQITANLEGFGPLISVYHGEELIRSTGIYRDKLISIEDSADI